MESEVLVKSSSSLRLHLIKIIDVPSLASSTVSTVGLNVLSFFIVASNNIKNLVVLDVDEFMTLISEELPPSRIGRCHSHI